MSSLWTINGTPVDTLGLSVVSGSMRSHGQSVMRLRAATDFDAAEILSFDDAVTLAYDGAPFFQGKVTATPKSANGSDETQFYEVGDAWADLEKTIYQEGWKIGGSITALLPRAVLGLGLVPGEEPGSYVWDRITIGAQIEAVLQFAIDNGTDLQIGTIPTGELMIPSEVANMSCAEVISQCLKLHPDWIPYIEHNSTPPTFNIAVSTTASAATFDITDGSVESVEIRHRTDMLPEGVRIVYELASATDGEVTRAVVIDKYPAGAPDAGPKIILATIPLAGMQAQTQKSRIQTRTIPTEAGTDCLTYLKKVFPKLAAVDSANMRCLSWSRTLVVDPDTKPAAANANMPAQDVEDVDDVPRELVRGSIEDWMGLKVADVRIEAWIKPTTAATKEEREIIDGLPRAFVVTATNGTTKLYRGLTQWVAAEDVPTGIAQATYSAIVAAMGYQGSITIVSDEVSATSYAGRSVGITGGDAEWITMKAPVHAVDFDIASGRTTVSFGPNPASAPDDFLELQRILRFRASKWWTTDERGSDKFGDETKPSAGGDTIDGFEYPKIQPQFLAEPIGQFQVHSISKTGATWTAKVAAGQILCIDPEGATVMAYTTLAEDELTITSAHKLYAKIETDKMDVVTAVSYVVSTTAPDNYHAQPDPGGQTGEYHYLIADFEMDGAVLVVKTQYHKGGPIIHRPARNNRNLNVTISAWKESTGVLEPDTLYSGPTGFYFRQGLYVGQTDPGGTAAAAVLSVITGAS